MGPPFERGINTIKKNESAGYDSVWYSDHLMSWEPESIWTPDIVEQATRQEDPNVIFETLCTMAVAAWNTKRILLGMHAYVLESKFLSVAYKVHALE